MTREVGADRTVAEIHETRREISQRFAGDVYAIHEDARRRLAESCRRVLRPSGSGRKSDNASGDAASSWIPSVSELWHSRDPQVWQHALDRYWQFVLPQNLGLERSLEPATSGPHPRLRCAGMVRVPSVGVFPLEIYDREPLCHDDEQSRETGPGARRTGATSRDQTATARFQPGRRSCGSDDRSRNPRLRHGRCFRPVVSHVPSGVRHGGSIRGQSVARRRRY